MTEENKQTQTESGSEQQTPISFNLVAQYARDVSLECPMASIDTQTDKVSVNMDVGIAIKKLEDTRSEVALKLRAESKTAEDKTCYLAEVEYAGVFETQGLSDDQLAGALSIDGAALIYPFARRVVMDLIQDAGYRAPIMDIVNFHALFMQAQQQQQAEALKNAEAAGAA